MEYASIEREIHIDAAPEVVFDVITSPSHICEWWGGVAADFEPVPGANGELVFGHKSPGDPMVVPMTVVDVVPPKLFSFRWVHPSGEVATASNSLLVTFELAASGAGTTLRMTENGFREIGWEEAVAVEAYLDHCNGWDTYVPSIGEYVMRLAAAS
ncbi:MAG TPA: SRPBCC domain-containing protein [Acidimicrobiales bacterium]|nr:SRPBCC domain-containing protein [Acidimicrobiales bacterium]